MDSIEYKIKKIEMVDQNRVKVHYETKVNSPLFVKEDGCNSIIYWAKKHGVYFSFPSKWISRLSGDALGGKHELLVYIGKCGDIEAKIKEELRDRRSQVTGDIKSAEYEIEEQIGMFEDALEKVSNIDVGGLI